jgi:hypothetical protein
MPRYACAAVAGALMLAACQSSPEPQRSSAPPPAPAAAQPQISRATPTRDEQACLQAVSIKTNNGDVVLLTGTETSEANNIVYIGVGPNRARWRCLVKNGRVSEVMSLTNEGRA